MANSYLIKRNPVFTEYSSILKINDPHKWYAESIITNSSKNPKSIKLQVGDIVYIAETSVGIFAKGTVKSWDPAKRYNNIKGLNIYDSVNEILDRDDIKERPKYWLDKMIKFYKKKKEDENYSFKLHEYFVEQKRFDRSISLTGSLKRLSAKGLASSFLELNKDEIEYLKPIEYSNLSNIVDIKINKLISEIPSKLKYDLHSLFNQNLKERHWIDIDHLIPKSVGGPGNLIENLVPVSASINRHKNNKIPKSFFDQLDDEGILIPSRIKNLISEKGNLSKHKDIKNYARDVLSDNVHKWNINDIKRFYFSIMEKEYPGYKKILSKFLNRSK